LRSQTTESERGVELSMIKRLVVVARSHELAGQARAESVDLGEEVKGLRASEHFICQPRQQAAREHAKIIHRQPDGLEGPSHSRSILWTMRW